MWRYRCNCRLMRSGSEANLGRFCSGSGGAALAVPLTRRRPPGGEACWQRALAPARLHKPAEVEVAEGVRCKAELAALPVQGRGGEEVVLHHCCLMGWHCCRSRMVVKKYSPQ